MPGQLNVPAKTCRKHDFYETGHDPYSLAVSSIRTVLGASSFISLEPDRAALVVVLLLLRENLPILVPLSSDLAAGTAIPYKFQYDRAPRIGRAASAYATLRRQS